MGIDPKSETWEARTNKLHTRGALTRFGENSSIYRPGVPVVLKKASFDHARCSHPFDYQIPHRIGREPPLGPIARCRPSVTPRVHSGCTCLHPLAPGHTWVEARCTVTVPVAYPALYSEYGVGYAEYALTNTLVSKFTLKGRAIWRGHAASSI